MIKESTIKEATIKEATRKEATEDTSLVVKFSQLLGQQPAIQQIQTALQMEDPPRAWLFHGPPHVGKHSTALALAAALNCEPLLKRLAQTEFGGLANSEIEACGECQACKLATAGNNLQISKLLPEGISIKIEQLRQAIDNLALSTSLWGRRVLIISRAETMRLETANALLKTLEEPSGKGVLILSTNYLHSLPETVASRCVKLPFRPLNYDSRQVLLKKAGLHGESLQFALRFSGISAGVWPLLLDHAEEWQQVEKILLDLLSSSERSFAKLSSHCTRWAAGDDWCFVLDWLEGWWHDVAVLKLRASQGDKQIIENAEQLKNSTLLNANGQAVLHKVAPQFSCEAAFRCYQDTLKTKQKISLWHANKQLSLEQLWLNWPCIS